MDQSKLDIQLSAAGTGLDRFKRQFPSQEVRVIREDGNWLTVTQDIRACRLCVELVRGVIVSSHYG